MYSAVRKWKKLWRGAVELVAVAEVAALVHHQGEFVPLFIHLYKHLAVRGRDVPTIQIQIRQAMAVVFARNNIN